MAAAAHNFIFAKKGLEPYEFKSALESKLKSLDNSDKTLSFRKKAVEDVTKEFITRINLGGGVDTRRLSANENKEESFGSESTRESVHSSYKKDQKEFFEDHGIQYNERMSTVDLCSQLDNIALEYITRISKEKPKSIKDLIKKATIDSNDNTNVKLLKNIVIGRNVADAMVTNNLQSDRDVVNDDGDTVYGCRSWRNHVAMLISFAAILASIKMWKKSLGSNEWESPIK